MTTTPENNSTEKSGLHPRNAHRDRYDFPVLIKAYPALEPFVMVNKHNVTTVDFTNPMAVKALNAALLKHHYNIESWDIPEGYLCPPIPGRADYIHYMADLLTQSNGGKLPKGSSIDVLDIGVGANCIYPILGRTIYGWKFVGSDIDQKALDNCEKIISTNDTLKGAVELRFQENEGDMLSGIVKRGELFDLTICNPPFHASEGDAENANRRKWRNLGESPKKGANLNFGGQPAELTCEGGEEEFISRMVQESAAMPLNSFWYTTLVSKESSLRAVYRALKKVKTREIRKIEMAQGQKISRVVAWTFLDDNQQGQWKAARGW
jgi:23S rRNA (adenine1618-N6)-methyltransferase